TTNRTLHVTRISRQRVLAGFVCSRELPRHGGAVCPRLSLHAKGGSDVARHSARRIFGGSLVGNSEVRFCIEFELFSLRSDLWLSRRCCCCADVELCFEFDPALRRSTHRSVPLRTSFGTDKYG